MRAMFAKYGFTILGSSAATNSSPNRSNPAQYLDSALQRRLRRSFLRRRLWPVWVDAFEKVRATRPGRNNPVKPGNILNRYCAFGSSLESMLLGKAAKILFRQHRS
jgi:hypothetical protein